MKKFERENFQKTTSALAIVPTKFQVLNKTKKKIKRIKTMKIRSDAVERKSVTQ